MITTIQEADQQVRTSADSITHRHITIDEIEVHQMVAQGDIGIVRIAKLPEGAKPIDPPAGGQVAPGNSKGSRHCVKGGRGQFYQFTGDTMSDICYESFEPWTLTHPEHGHVTMPPGLDQFVHQQNERRQRVID